MSYSTALIVHHHGDELGAVEGDGGVNVLGHISFTVFGSRGLDDPGDGSGKRIRIVDPR